MNSQQIVVAAEDLKDRVTVLHLRAHAAHSPDSDVLVPVIEALDWLTKHRILLESWCQRPLPHEGA